MKNFDRSLGLCAEAVCFSLLFAMQCLAQPSPAAIKSIQLSKIVKDDETYSPNLHVKVGTICLFSGNISILKQKTTLPYERFENLFVDNMKKQGFNVVSTSQDLFSTDQDKNKADYLLGGTMYTNSIDVCSSVNGVKGAIDIKIEWQLYDRQAHKVVETIMTNGVGKREKFDRLGFLNMYNDAFVSSLGALIAGGVIQKYVGLPAPISSAATVTVPASAALSKVVPAPEALQSAAPTPTAPAASPTPSSTTPAPATPAAPPAGNAPATPQP